MYSNHQLEETFMQEESTTVLDPSQMEHGKVTQPWEYTTKEERDSVKVRLSKISPVARSPKVKEILHRIEQEEKAEDRTAALWHTLIERADTWGRKQLSCITGNTSDAAGKLLSSQAKLLKEIATAHNRLVESAKDRTKRAMQQLQDQLCEELRKLDTDKRAAEDKVFSEIRPKLAEQERLLAEGKERVTDIVGKFTSCIGTLPLYDLERLAEGKSVRIAEPQEGGGGRDIEVVCPDVEGP
jgi:hypothetical protein